ncbi:MAG TPA: hypothetical protein VMR74_15025 [Gammaproteobacteria bacterium]|nr:hypothetical protein [Gammaproteobacteria bacterium]
MIFTFARIVVQAFGVLIVVASLWGLVAPQSLVGLVRRVASNTAGLGFAVGIRILLGAALLTAAQVSRFPTAFTVLGWVAIVAAIGLLIMGRGRMAQLVNWVSRWSPTAIRAWLVLGLLFGAFLIFGA